MLAKSLVSHLWGRCMENKKFNGTNRAQTLTFYLQQVKGGDLKMAEEFNNKDTATLGPTKAGNGLKLSWMVRGFTRRKQVFSIW